MNRIAEYIDELKRKFQQQAPQFDLLLKISGIGFKEGFQLSYSAGVITVEAENVLAAAYALNRLSMSLCSNQLAENLGKNAPSFSLRPLWFVDYNISNLNESKIEKICRRLIEWGYNAVCLGLKFEDLEAYSLNASYLEIIRQFGLKLIISPQVAHPQNIFFHDQSIRKKFQQKLDKLKNLDYFLWKGTFLNPAIRQRLAHNGMLQRDYAREEVQLIENCLNGSLIYFVPFDNHINKQEDWLPDFFDDVGKNTLVSFPAVAGNETMDYLPPHPLWFQLRQCPDVSSTRLLPIINGGLIGQGEGRWPVLPLDSLERFISRCYRHHFAGVLVVAKYFPAKEGWVDASLWISGQSLWDRISPHLLAETWFKVFRSDIDYSSMAPFLKEITFLIRQLNLLSLEEKDSEKTKVVAESIFIRLKALFFLLPSKHEQQSCRLTIRDYLTLFETELKKAAIPFISSHRHLNVLENSQNSDNQTLEQLIYKETQENL
jgi:hypothetical protein